ncbi:WD repeat-containing protein 27 isoform X3 [Syngnathoides biaculeatus]|uniref:WD repeat-containing protein 27 isoform X3 n=1 Tax=Syngnathoides biaculeatus TaxID=300417 RepID=UPI002ADDDE6F|nr:WD repeat-containing protein 27 isoform X3 [Syngnathoides biaculeatus]
MIVEKFKLTCDRLLSYQQLACCYNYTAIPLRGGDILLYSNSDVEKTFRLSGHYGEITSMTFGKGKSPVLLCSASADYIIVWNVEVCLSRLTQGSFASGTVIASSLGEVVHLSFCFSDGRVVACSGAAAYILSSQKQERISTLTGHLGPVTSAEFCPWDKHILVTTSEDRTFKLWDLHTETALYQSFVLSASPLLSVFFMVKKNYMITGSTDGQVWCFSFSNTFSCQLVTKIDLDKSERRHQAGVAEKSSEVDISKPVLKMASFGSSNDNTNAEKRDESWLCIASTDGLYIVNLATSELVTVLHFTDYPNLSITMAGSWVFSDKSNNSILFLVSSLFTPCVSLLDFCLGDAERNQAGSQGFSVFPSSSPLLESPLVAEFKKKEPNHVKKKGGIKEQPLVFHSKVKSSGYTSSPRMVLFSPKSTAQKSKSTMKPKKKGLLLKDYPEDIAAPTVLRVRLSITNKPIFCLQYSGDGKQILCGLGDNSVLLYKSSLTGNPTVYTGHDKPVSSVSWSLSRQCWLSASHDQTLRLWTHDIPEPAVIMGKNMFSKFIKAAQFYYLDKFLLLASGDSIHLYLYHVDVSHDDIKRYQQRSFVQLSSSFSTSSGADITDLSAINDFFSYIVVACASDRSIQVFDMNKGEVIAELPDVHSRAVHSITQNKGSMFSTQAPESYNLFLTSAVTDGVKLWDLRTLRISPCGRFIACGSEDKCVYVYDIRSSSYLHKLQRDSETVLSVAFNPGTPQLLTGTLDGKISVFDTRSGLRLSHIT